ncbi:MAG: hypothetical protein QHH19_04605 [Candidatus Thermoplasmatota archaeon]|nr:hypothetical protein [Candidatus Thermoplasmatota archaeon]
MEKNLVESFKSQYVKLIKDTGEILDGTITEIFEDTITFQTELSRSAISINSIKEIIPYDELKKRKKYMSGFKI